MSGSRRPKSPWYSRSRRAQEHWKGTTHQLPDAARAAGRTWVESRGERVAVGPFPVCLPESHAAHNLLPEIRAEALRRFADHGIQWHGATPGPDGPLPSTHLLDSQVQCVNALLCLAQCGQVTWILGSVFTNPMRSTLSASQLALLREQRMSALGGLAAAAAHELGTPLSTIAVVSKVNRPYFLFTFRSQNF